jgi:preprotein translocase subunit SecD
VVGLIILSTWLVPTAAASAATKGHSSGVTFRAVLCFAPLAPAKPKFSQSAALPECRPKFRLTAQNLGVKPDNAAAGFTSKNVAPDSRFLEFPDSASTDSSLTSNELLPGIKGSRTERYVLGPARVTSSAIKSAKAVKQSLGQWVVTYQLTTAGNVAFNALAKSQFHALVAIVANGEVYSAPLMQPTQTHFTTFGGSGEISGSFTEAQAKYLAQQMVASKP